MTGLDLARLRAETPGCLERIHPRDLVGALRQRSISASAQIRAYAVLDYDRKGVAASLRLSPHYFNTAAELAEAVAALREILAG